MNVQSQTSEKFLRITGLVGLILIIPMTWFYIHVFLKYFLSVDSFFDIIDSVVSIKFIEILMVLSPLGALALNAIPITRIQILKQSDTLSGNISFRLRRLNIVVCLLSVCYLAVIIAYGFTENFCYCHG